MEEVTAADLGFTHTAVENQARMVTVSQTPPQGFRASHSGSWPGGGRQAL